MKKSVATISIILSSINISYAQGVVGDWTYGFTTDRNRIFSATVNDSGSVFGRYCHIKSGDCFWILAVDSKCTTSNKYPLMVNSDSGSFSVDGLCAGRTGERNYQLVLSEYEIVEKSAKSDSDIGFAIPMASGAFKVYRFKLNGCSASISEANDLFNRKKPSGTRTQTL